jgi:hypothetical protein
LPEGICDVVDVLQPDVVCLATPDIGRRDKEDAPSDAQALNDRQREVLRREEAPQVRIDHDLELSAPERRVDAEEMKVLGRLPLDMVKAPASALDTQARPDPESLLTCCFRQQPGYSGRSKADSRFPSHRKDILVMLNPAFKLTVDIGAEQLDVVPGMLAPQVAQVPRAGRHVLTGVLEMRQVDAGSVGVVVKSVRTPA